MQTPGFIIRNDTIWPLQISLEQVGPLYYDVILPGQTFVRDTGAVWFTIRAALFLNETQRITDWDVARPFVFFGGAALSFLCSGALGFALGTAMSVLTVAEIAQLAIAAGTSEDAIRTSLAAASALHGAGLARTARLVAGDEEVDPGKPLIAKARAELEHVFAPANVELSSPGAYAGPPWPFRREVTPLRITGGPTFQRVPGKEQVELVPGRLCIDTQSPPTHYRHFVLQTGTALPADAAHFRFLLAANRDLFAIKTSATGSGTTEIHVLTAASGYRQFALQTRTALHPTDATWEFGIAANRDLFAIRKRGGASNSTEVHILSAEHGYQRFARQTRTPLPPSEGDWAFAIAPNRDVVAIKKNGTQSGTTEVHVLAAWSDYQGFALQTRTALHETDASWDFDVASNGDLFAFRKHGTASGTCEVHVLSAGADYRSFALQTKTALHEVDDSWTLRVAENRDVIAIRASGGASDSTEVHGMQS